MFFAECVAVVEDSDGNMDTAVVSLVREVAVNDFPTTSGTSAASTSAGKRGKATTFGKGGSQKVAKVQAKACVDHASLPAAVVAHAAVAHGAQLFCVGNPSNINLESTSKTGIEFEPPAWHTSVGACQGYMDMKVQALHVAQSKRGRPPTRGEVKAVRNAESVAARDGGHLQHSCWTYWGHSGAPLFNQAGEVTGLHSAWDSSSGMRHGQKLQHLHAVIHTAIRDTHGGVDREQQQQQQQHGIGAGDKRSSSSSSKSSASKRGKTRRR